jgi:16S rRNA (guanine527-N7)-methyltransferase
MIKNKDLLKESLNILGIECSEDKIDRFNDYYDLLIKWNENINLTAITEYEDVVIKHFIDSILICTFTDIGGCKIIDVGTGAGFPGIPLKILYPECEMFLLDSLNKRVKFLEETVKALDLNKISCIHGRAEDLARKKEYRGAFDISVSRAVANLSTLSEYCIPFLKTGGLFISYKSDKSDEEVRLAENAIKLLGAKLLNVEECSLPGSDIKRKFVIIESLGSTNKRFPRKAGIPVKDPL